jgi:hypothetical protein
MRPPESACDRGYRRGCQAWNLAAGSTVSSGMDRAAHARRRALRPTLLALALGTLAVVLAACAGAAASPSPPPSPRPTPTPVIAKVVTPEDAATLVIATDPRFSGAAKLDPEIIGASRWWQAEPLDGGGYRIRLTVGWGDCMAGCIDRHIWTFDVAPDGAVTLVSEEGPDVPTDLPA